MKTVLVEKMKASAVLRAELIIGIVLMSLAAIFLPLSIYCIDPILLTEPLMLAVVFIGASFFALVGLIGFVRPYLLYRKTPEVIVEADEEFLYIHTKNEVKIPLSKLSEAVVDVDNHFIWQVSFLRRILVYLLSDRYGDIVLEVADYGRYKLRFVSQVEDTAAELLRFLDETMNKEA